MSSDMTSLGAILVIGKLEGLTREVEGGFNLTFSYSEPKPFPYYVAAAVFHFRLPYPP